MIDLLQGLISLIKFDFGQFITIFNGIQIELSWFLFLFFCLSSILIFLKLFGEIGLYIYTIVAVIAGNIQVLKVVKFSFFLEPVALGTILFSSIFLCTDILAEYYGSKSARKNVIFGFSAFLLMTLIMLFTLGFKPINLADIGPDYYWAIEVQDHLGWHQQRDGKWYLGIFISSGRIKDFQNIKIKSGLREVINTFKPTVTLSTDQNIFLGNINEKDKKLIDIILKNNLITGQKISKVNRWFLACPALPTCGLALTEAERVRDELIKEIDKILFKHSLTDEKISIRITGCPNGCARPYAGDIGIVGRAPNQYSLFSGGDFEGTRLNTKILDKVSYKNLTIALDQIFLLFKENRNKKETLGNFCNRVGPQTQFKKIKEVLNEEIQ